MDYALIETMRFDPGTGIARLPLHMARLQRSARRLGFSGFEAAEEKLMEVLGESLPPSVGRADISPTRGEINAGPSLAQTYDGAGQSKPQPISPLVGEMPDRAEGGEATHSISRIRLILTPDGRIDITATPFTPLPETTIWRLRIAATRLSSADPLTRYKTTRRATYEAARAEYTASEADEVLLLNEKDEPCEGTITSLFLDDGSGILKTPPIACGLLAGVLRTELICARRARVQRFSLADLVAGRIYMGNSLRGLIPAVLQTEEGESR